MTPGVFDPSPLLKHFNFPDDMRDMRVLEIGSADGYFTKALDSRGASVVAMDVVPKDKFGFSIMEKLHGKPLRYVQSNLYDVDKHGFSPFDYVLCIGVLYRLPDMLRGLWSLRPYTAGELLIETSISRKIEDRPIAEYLPAASCNDDSANFWIPNSLCVHDMLADCGFVVTDTLLGGTRGVFRARLDPAPDAGAKMRTADSVGKRGEIG